MTAVICFAASPGIANAQSQLDTTGLLLTTRVTQKLAPTANDRWEFSRIRDIEIDSRGFVYVLDDTDQAIRVFAQSGQLIRTIGRQGAGPGEFNGATWMQTIADTLWVYDSRNNRVTAFLTTTGKLLRTLPMFPSMTFALHRMSPVGAYFKSASRDGKSTIANPVVVSLIHERASNHTRSTLASFSWMHGTMDVNVYHRGQVITTSVKPSGSIHFAQPLDAVTLSTAGRNGRSIMTVDRGAAATTGSNPFGTAKNTTTSLHILEVGFGGDTLLNRTYGTPAIPVTSQQLNAIVDSLSHVARILSGTDQFLLAPADIRDSMFVPKVWPPITEFFVGQDGTIWLRQPQPPAPFAKFWRVAGDGTILPSVSVASGIRIMRVSANRIWGVREDIDGVPTIEIRDVVR